MKASQRWLDEKWKQTSGAEESDIISENTIDQDYLKGMNAEA